MHETSKIPLGDFQQWMQQLLLDPYQQTGVNPGNLLPGGHSVESSIHYVIRDSEKLSAREHLAIYQRSYILRLRNCMSQQFSALEYALGETLFCTFADDYLASRPSYHYNLSYLGAHFAEYLEENRPDAHDEVKEEWIDFMIELARFEYAIGVLFEVKAQEEYRLATVETPDDALKLLPVFSLFKFRFPVHKYYLEVKNGKEPGLAPQQESYCVVLRHNFRLSIYDVHREQYDFLSFLKEGTDIETAKQQIKASYKQDGLTFETAWGNWKARWTSAHFFKM